MRRSASFPSKRQAQTWSAEVEADILAGKGGVARGDKTLCDALERFLLEVLPLHRGHVREATTLKRWMQAHPLRGRRLDQIAGHEIAAWRDARLTEVAPGSVLREMTILRSVLESARRDWGWIGKNPMQDVRRPPQPKPRSRRPTEDEILRLCAALGGAPVVTKQHEAALAMLLSIETAMRAGELLRATCPPDEVRTVRIEQTKNGDAREVPLSPRAIELLKSLPEGRFTVESRSLDALFRKARDRCGIEDLHFHDMRAEALTRLSKKV